VPRPRPAGRIVLPDPVRRRLSDLDEDFAAFYAEQFDQRWGDGELAPRERALTCIAVDALDQTLDEPFELHVRLGLTAGATQVDIHAVLLLVAEYGLDRAWRAYRALHDLEPRGE
jgi:4-carboxymuconolactone decarboxylase